MGTFNNLLVIGVCLALTSGLGTYVTFFRQADELERLTAQEEEAKVMSSEVSDLLSQQAATQEEANDILVRWNARYKLIPQELQTTQVMAYLNSLTETGFRQFDVRYGEHIQQEEYNTHVYQIAGRAFFNDLYAAIWAIENNRDFYRVESLALSHFDLLYEDPATGRPRMDVLVSFSFDLHAFYGGNAGLSADDDAGLVPENVIRIDYRGELPQVPSSVLPDSSPAKNPFHPLILETIPPNTDGLPEIELAQLLAITGSKAVFTIEDELVELGIGDPVYLGQIVAVDPRAGRVLARLNKGGIIDEIEMVLETGELFRQAMGPNSLTPSGMR